MLYTAECVTPMHPDKICDQISDAILDECLYRDPDSRVAVETMGGHGKITITGEITSKMNITNAIIRAIVYFHFPFLHGYDIKVNIVHQSPDIAKGVDQGGAGDQGIMIGYACNFNPEFVPQEYFLARKLARGIWDKYGARDGKTQVTINENQEAVAIVASFQGIKAEALERYIRKTMSAVMTEDCEVKCNAAGDWTNGGFDADTGLTGRKIAVDNYGPTVPIGGGAFSGKDGTKVDRSGAYMARKIAVDFIKEHDARQVLVKLAYSIGVAEPVMAIAIVDGVEAPITGYDLTPAGIIKTLELKTPRFQHTAEWGHMGNKFIWG